ncbi:MAG: TIR domain-containing protein [Candidatus Thiodiazotropha sp.]
MTFPVEEIYRTEGVPEYTFVRPPNYNEILVDLRNPGKPMVVEGQSGTGKTTAVRKIIERSLPDYNFEYLSARNASDVAKIGEIATNGGPGSYVIDDFHRLANHIQEQLGDVVKIAAEENDPDSYPKIVLIGINRVGSELIHFVPDVAKRVGIHRIQPADEEGTMQLIQRGEENLNISIENKEVIFNETQGDYWVTQLLCQMICLLRDVTETLPDTTNIPFDIAVIRNRVADRLEHTYNEAVKEFCRGKRFRSSNDPYFKLLREVSRQDSSIVDLQMLANSAPEVKGSINNIKEKRLSILLDSKPICSRYFYYNSETKNFAIEDPALFYYLKHLDWEELRQECGFKHTDKDYEFDFAISFAGENREIARTIAIQLEVMDCSVFFDELFENNYLGKAWGRTFEEIFKQRSRLVVCVLDEFHREKIWPTFERECFSPRVADEAVIPVFLDETVFPGIPQDIVGIKFQRDPSKDIDDQVTDDIVFRILERLDDV